MLPHTRLPAALLAGALALVACRPPDVDADRTAAPVEQARPTGAVPPLTAEGWGALSIGMPRAELIAAAGGDANPGAVGGPDPAACEELRPERAPRGMRVMLEGGRVTRISLSAPAEVRTASGIGIGDPASAVRTALGTDFDAMPHKYLEAPAEYLTSWSEPQPGGEARGIRYEIGVDRRVLHIHAGGPSIGYVEGCL